MTWQLEYHPRVVHDLHRIEVFLTEYDGQRTARCKLHEIADTLEKILQLPFRGSRHDDVAPGLRITVGGKKAVIAYRLREEARIIRIISVTYGGADWQKIARRRR
mgnify:CR=1 FL=1